MTRESFTELLEMDRVAVAPVTRKTGKFYGTVYDSMKKAGTQIPDNDIWIAATVLETGGELYTRDSRLSSLPMIRIVK